VPPLEADELDHLLEIYASPARFTAVDLGDEVVLSCDGTGMKTHATRLQDMQSFEAVDGRRPGRALRGRHLAKVGAHHPALRSSASCTMPAGAHGAVQYGVMPIWAVLQAGRALRELV